MLHAVGGGVGLANDLVLVGYIAIARFVGDIGYDRHAQHS